MQKIELLRHAQSLFNRYGIDERDCGITNQGREQASKIEGYWDLVICSPMRRCRETLEASQIKYGELKIEEMCRERRDSQCDFFYKEEVPKESVEELLERCSQFKNLLRELRKKYNTILVVSHSGFIWHLTSFLNENGHRIGWRLDNCQKMTFHLGS